MMCSAHNEECQEKAYVFFQKRVAEVDQCVVYQECESGLMAERVLVTVPSNMQQMLWKKRDLTNYCLHLQHLIKLDSTSVGWFHEIVPHLSELRINITSVHIRS